MVIDSHVHLEYQGSEPQEFLHAMARMGITDNEKSNPPKEKYQEIFDALVLSINDPEGKTQRRKMKLAGIERAVLSPLDIWMALPNATSDTGNVSIREKNELYHRLVSENPDKLSMMVGIDPRRHDSLVFFNSMMKRNPKPVGLKFQTASGFYPDDKEICYPFYQACMDWSVPVLIHCGAEPAPLKSKFSQPVNIDTIASDFPELKIIIAHCGLGWWNQVIDIASQKPNIYVDFSNWQLMYQKRPEYFWTPLRKALDVLTPWRVLFGTDGPFADLLLSPKMWVTEIQQKKNRGQIEFTEREIEIFLHDAAKRLFHF